MLFTFPLTQEMNGGGMKSARVTRTHAHTHTPFHAILLELPGPCSLSDNVDVQKLLTIQQGLKPSV